jgi:hypothetical protein
MIKKASNGFFSNIKVVELFLLFPNWARASPYHA